MAKNVYDPQKHYKCCLYGHNFDKSLQYIILPGRFEADTIEQLDPLTRDSEFAVFKVDRPQNGEYPVHWAGTFLIPMGFLRGNPPEEIAD